MTNLGAAWASSARGRDDHPCSAHGETGSDRMNDSTQLTAELSRSNSGPVPKLAYFCHLQASDPRPGQDCQPAAPGPAHHPHFIVPEDVSTLLSRKFTPGSWEPLPSASERLNHQGQAAKESAHRCSHRGPVHGHSSSASRCGCPSEHCRLLSPER